jgi:hypothetical protein
MKNSQVAGMFHEIADFLELSGEDPFRIRDRRLGKALEINAYPFRPDIPDARWRCAGIRQNPGGTGFKFPFPPPWNGPRLTPRARLPRMKTGARVVVRSH